MTGICSNRVVLVTGAGRGIGREHALEFARQGAKVVVNDTGADVHGIGADPNVADAVVEEIRALGGEAVASHHDVSDYEQAQAMITAAFEAFGRIDTLVNNAGTLRDRMLVNMSREEWDSIMNAHLGTTFNCAQILAAHWRSEAKEGPRDIEPRIINTSSPSGLYGNIGQTNYGAAKAGIAAFTIIAAEELKRYGVTVNAIAPGARTRMTENLNVLDGAAAGDQDFDEMSPANIAPLVVWLGSDRSTGITGRVFNVWGGKVSVADGWTAGKGIEKKDRWNVFEIDELLPAAVQESPGPANIWGELSSQ